MKKGLRIKYGDIVPEAKENFKPTASESEFDTVSQLQRYYLQFPNLSNPCELYSVVLNGASIPLPSDPENNILGLWSEQVSRDDGYFTTPIELELKSNYQFSSKSLTFTFDTYNNIFATAIWLEWYRNGVLVDSQWVYPDSAKYTCEKEVKEYDEIFAIFYSINMPQNKLKLRAIDFGNDVWIEAKNLRKVKLLQEISPISTEISINTADFTIDTINDAVNFDFKAKQPLSVYFNGELRSTTFVKSAKRKSQYVWDIQSEDYIGLLDSVPYYGGIYTKARVIDVLPDIFAVANVPYTIDNIFADATITGYIPYTTCRDAVMQVAFAIQAVVDTSNSDAVKIFALEEDIKQTVPLNRIMQGQNFGEEEIVTSVEVSAHSYRPMSNVIDLYSAEDSGVGEGIFVKFNEPAYDLGISHGEIIKSGSNYAIINAYEGCRLWGHKYEHTVKIYRKNNTVISPSIKEKIVSIENATLVSQDNIDNVLEKCYNWLTMTDSTNLKIVEGKHIHYGTFAKYGVGLKYNTGLKYGDKSVDAVTYDQPVNVGENINVETQYKGVVSGRLIKQSFNLNGNIIIKEAVLK